MARIVGVFGALLVLLWVAGCGGSGTSNVSVLVNPVVVTLKKGESQQFGASVMGSSNQKVEWLVEGGGGTITPGGLFTAGNSAGSFQVRATSLADRTASSVATVNVTSDGGTATITWETPDSLPPIIPKSRYRFSAIVAGTPNTDVEYSVEGQNSGTISDTGVWVAPDAPGTFTIVATSKEDSSLVIKKNVTTVADAFVKWTIEGKGEFVLRLRPDEAPRHSANLISLVNERFYDGIVMHRYEPGFVIQWGCPFTKTLPLDNPQIGSGGPGYQIDFEANPLQHEKYALGMARSSEMNSAGSQVYICVEPAPSLDGNYVVFGAVESGFDVVDSLRRGDKITKAEVIPATE